MRVAFLGPEGTHTGEAARSVPLLAGWTFDPEPTVRAAFERFARGEADAAVLPIENALEGSVGPTLDLLAGDEGAVARIRREIVRPIAHALLAPPGASDDPAGVRGVASHPQALAQCAESLGARYPGAILDPAPSTAEAARRVAEGRPGWLALATKEAAARFGLEVRAEDLSDRPGNRTRFVLLMREDEPASTGRDRTSIVFGLDRDRPGGLWEVLGEFARRGINLSRIESRPTRQVLGEYVFFVDLEAHRAEAPAADALDAVARSTAFYRLLGSYPRA